MNAPKLHKDYDELRYSQKDLWAIIAKISVGLAFAVFVYARFITVEATQQSILKDDVELEKRLNNKIELLEAKVDDNNSKMYRHVADKEREIEGRLDRKTGRNEKEILENKLQVRKNTERIIVLETKK